MTNFVARSQSKIINFASLNINDTGIYKCQSTSLHKPRNEEHIDYLNEIVIEIKKKKDLYLIDWYSSCAPRISLDLSSATDYFSAQPNLYVREFNTDLNIECLDSLGGYSIFYWLISN